MMNLKKGLALVLAAATAFTFAPVADFGGSYVAEAADTTEDKTEVTYKVDGDDWKALTDSEVTETKKNKIINLDTVENKTAQITVANTSAAIYVTPENAEIVNTSADNNTKIGTITALKAGSTRVNVQVGNAKYTIPVEVSDTVKDVVKAQVNGKDVTEIELDKSDSTALNAIKSVKLTGVSAQNLPVTMNLYESKDAKDPITGNTNSVATLASDGTITAGKSAGTVYVKLSTAGDNGKRVTAAADKWVTVTVNDNPEAIINAPETIKLDLDKNKTADLSKLISTNAVAKAGQTTLITYTKGSSTSENANAFDVLGNVLTAKQIGEATLVVNVAEGTNTRATTKNVHISVVADATPVKKAGEIKTESFVRLTEGSTAVINAAVTGGAVTYTSEDPTVATVDPSTGLVTAVSAGVVTIDLNSAETADYEAATAKVVVIVDAKPVEPAKVLNPEKVTGVKVGNKKGAYVTVKWTNQEDGINYRVYKKVGNGKWVGKNVTNGSGKAVLSVKKGATVKVKVRAYTKDNGRTIWAKSYSKTLTKKTDKK